MALVVEALKRGLDRFLMETFMTAISTPGEAHAGTFAQGRASLLELGAASSSGRGPVAPLRQPVRPQQRRGAVARQLRLRAWGLERAALPLPAGGGAPASQPAREPPRLLRTCSEGARRGAAMAGADEPPCGLCLAERAPYTCPRCRLRYCSAACYARHGACARDFQRRQLRERLRGQRADPAAGRRLAQALLRLEEPRPAGEADPEPEPEAEAEAEELWARLSPEQRAAFRSLLRSGRAAALLPPWRPWWAGGGEAPLVQEAEGPPSQQGPPGRAPRLPGALPPLAALRRAPASPLVRFQLPNVLCAYAYASALYLGRGGCAELLPEFCGTLLDVSGALGAGQVFGSTAEALQAALQAAAALRYPECVLGGAGVLLAAAQILRGACPARRKEHSLAALAHLCRLLGRAKRRVSAEDRPRVFRAQKKCRFLLSWANENEGALAVLALEAQREHRTHLAAAREVGALTQEFEKMWGASVPPPARPLIEELEQRPQPGC
ncbi:zinc finger HIT domain-containing protein 2 [Tiliqua scincoides]|uniref:zinc finger HIT domain-containing protein 2 n=1 Tax=Tiliqua scincoides TaxID=71010 RepID=UPI0034638118